MPSAITVLWPSGRCSVLGGDDVEASVLEWEMGGIGGKEDDIASPFSSLSREANLIRIHVDTDDRQPEGLSDMEGCHTVAAAHVQVGPAGFDR